MTGVEATTPVLRALVRDVALENSHANRQALMVLRRQRTSQLLEANQTRQNQHVNERRKQPRIFDLGDFVFVSKSSQSTGKLDSGMRGPYKVIQQLPHHRYELELLAGSYGKRTQAAAEHMVLWRGEWTPDTCAAFFTSGESPNSHVRLPHGSYLWRVLCFNSHVRLPCSSYLWRVLCCFNSYVRLPYGS